MGKHHRNRESTLAQFLAPALTFSHSPLWGKKKVQVVSTSLRPVVCARCGRRVEITTSRGCRSSRIKQTWENVGHGDEMRETSSVSGVGQKYRWGKYMSRGHPPCTAPPLHPKILAGTPSCSFLMWQREMLLRVPLSRHTCPSNFDSSSSHPTLGRP